MTNFVTLIVILAVAIPILIAQGTWIFLDARKRGERLYWLWGLLGLIQTPIPLIVYLLVTRMGETRCKSCKKAIAKSCKVCPYCGEKVASTCRKCGGVVQNDWEYCPNCNVKLKEE